MGRGCHVPKLTGLTLSAARERAAHAHCKLRVKGAALEEAEVQTVERQSPARGGRSSSLTVWLNPLCQREAAYGPELKEPLVTPGQTELVSGFFLVGGPLGRRFSTPGCKLPAPLPGAGTVEVTNASGEVVATQTSTSGHFVEIQLPAGSYTITGTFLGATINGVHPKHSESIVIPPGHSVRQDFFLSIP
ncbi:MAG TPA: carboxypeptidase-like regulatory domain-containing protein [Solirubrobacteraceae bacterium]|nr:carboxypeptidase-like regulatory domain-containing protein [Solirubrobacteraceae bacterium]